MKLLSLSRPSPSMLTLYQPGEEIVRSLEGSQLMTAPS